MEKIEIYLRKKDYKTVEMLTGRIPMYLKNKCFNLEEEDLPYRIWFQCEATHIYIPSSGKKVLIIDTRKVYKRDIFYNWITFYCGKNKLGDIDIDDLKKTINTVNENLKYDESNKCIYYKNKIIHDAKEDIYYQLRENKTIII